MHFSSILKIAVVLFFSALNPAHAQVYNNCLSQTQIVNQGSEIECQLKPRYFTPYLYSAGYGGADSADGAFALMKAWYEKPFQRFALFLGAPTVLRLSNATVS